MSPEFETSGYILNDKDIDELMKLDDIYYLAEVMDFKGVIKQRC
ncbi:adenine deaminase [Borreliella burgdorferi]|uniref:Adenine deaminase n=1 Tax=Borreliella burgdorferi 118a TaxID=476210 RepID=A0A7U3YAU8_BORBG|nr:adenine deaminase [Borreliella burgdorferi]ACN92679.1 adenine deaminase [Borreliella burgdorferi 118a]